MIVVQAGLYVVSLVGVASRNDLLYLLTWVVGKEKVTTLSAMLSALARLVRVRCATGCHVGGSGTLATLGGCTTTLGAATGVGTDTLAADAGVVLWSARMVGGLLGGVGVLKMARRLSTASSWAWQLFFERSARMATVRARRQWMILSVVVSVGTDSVGCWKTIVSDTMTAAVDVLMILWHL